MPTLVIRLRNWVGDVTLGVPTLRRLDAAGFTPWLVGRRWAADLLRGEGWRVEPLPAGARDRVALLRRLAREARAADPGFARQRLQAVCLPYSFGSALEFRLAGLRTLGHAWEGRRLLLAQAVARDRSRHELEVYWALGDAVLGRAAPLPERIGLRVHPDDAAAADALLAAHGVAPAPIVVCPFAGGTYRGQEKTWPAFADFVARVLPRFGRPVLVCPGPGEEAIARARFASATCVAGVGLGVYAALLQRAALMVSNDTGPGHLAAAVGCPTVAVFGPGDAVLWRPWGPTVTVVQAAPGWPDVDAVTAAAARMLGRRG